MIHKLIIIYYYLNLHKPINLLYNLQQKYRQHSRTNLFRQHWNNHFNSLFLALTLRTRLHYSFFLMSASEVESEGLGNFFWCPWEFGFKRMQHPSSILPWWLCTVIHIKTLPVSSEKCSAHPSKWKCISITAALFLPLHSICVCHSIHLDWLSSSAPLDLFNLFSLKLSCSLSSFTQHYK